MKITVLFTTFVFVFTATFSLAHAQTKDAIAIRKVLEDEKIGWKRGDIEKITEHYQPHFTGYDGVEKADPRSGESCLATWMNSRTTSKRGSPRWNTISKGPPPKLRPETTEPM